MKIVLIDGDYIPYKLCYNKKEEPEKSIDEIYSLITFYMNNLLKKVDCNEYIGYLSPKKTFRNDINESYKAQRKPSNIPFLKEAKQYLIDKYRFVQYEGLEADDCCLITENLLKNKYEVIVISPDKDIKNTFGNRYCPNKQEFTECDEEQQEYYFWSSMIIGDSADNIKGLIGKGEKYVEKIFNKDEPLNYMYCVLYEYTNHFGEYIGIQEFYKNYISLYILREYKDFVIPEIQTINKSNKVLIEFVADFVEHIKSKECSLIQCEIEKNEWLNKEINKKENNGREERVEDRESK